MLKRRIFTIMLVCICFTLIWGVILYFDLRFVPMRIENNLTGLLDDNSETLEQLGKIYDANFVFDKASMKTAHIYLPKYSQTNEDTAAFYAGVFGFNGSFSEYEDYFLYKNGDESLYIDKYASHISYDKAGSLESASSEPLENDVVAEKAKSVAREKALGLKYERISVNFDGNIHIVKFIGRLDSYNDYSFPCQMKFNQNGDLLSIDYHYFEYEQIASVNLKTMKEAYKELPADFDEGTRIDLNSCQVVYMYEDSVIQPAYLFEGEVIGEKTFQCFVKAAKYD